MEIVRRVHCPRPTPTLPQRLKRRIHLAHIEGCRVELAANPLEHRVEVVGVRHAVVRTAGGELVQVIVLEFLASDRPLTAQQQAAMHQLSSRVQLSSTSAVFTYAFGNFRGEPLDVLAKHFDAMLYLANWGSKQLAFRFPKGAVDLQALQPYYYGVDEIEVRTVGEHVILDIAFHGDWIDDEPGCLAPLAPLRDDLLRGDLRALYLA